MVVYMSEVGKVESTAGYYKISKQALDLLIFACNHMPFDNSYYRAKRIKVDLVTSTFPQLQHELSQLVDTSPALGFEEEVEIRDDRGRRSRQQEQFVDLVLVLIQLLHFKDN